MNTFKFDLQRFADIPDVKNISNVQYFDASGNSMTSATGSAITIDGTTSPKKVTISKTVEGSCSAINLTGTAVSISDTTGSATFATVDGVSTNTFKVKGTATLSDTSTITSATGTITLLDNVSSITTKATGAAYNISDTTSIVVIPAGTSINGTKITTYNKKTFTLTETNSNSTTNIDGQGNIVDADGNITVTGAFTEQSIFLKNSGTLNINGKKWKFEGDDEGFDFTVNTSEAGNVEKLTINQSGTISTTENLSGSTAFKNENNMIATIISAKKGLSYTEVTSDEYGSFTLSTAGDSIKIHPNNYTDTLSVDTVYTINKVSNSVTIDTTGKITGLTNGEKVTVTNGTDTYVYEVSGGTLVTTRTNSSGGITTSTSILADGEENGFSISAGELLADNRTTDTSKAKDIAGFIVGGKDVTTVTEGMQLDKNGNATTSSEKTIAKVTIEEDGNKLKYASQKDTSQTVTVTTANTKDWDITTGGKRDFIVFAGSGETSISSGAGNDTISVTGSGDAVIHGDKGKNTIEHTGTGTATIDGGTGNDTITSSNSEDVISGGGGENTFILTTAETHVSDFGFGKDKAIVSTAEGKLDVENIKVTSEGIIRYEGTGSTGGSLNVSEQSSNGFYAVTLTDSKGHNKRNVGWTGENGGVIDASSMTERVLLIGNDSGANDILMGGKASDTILTGSGDSSLWGGAGNDLLESSSESSNSIFFLEGDGNDTVTGFTPYDEDSTGAPDTIDFFGQGITGVKNTSQGIKLYHGSDRMLLSGEFTANTMIQWKSGDAQGIAKIGMSGEKNEFSYNGKVTNYIGSTGIDTISVGADDGNVSIWMDGSQGVSYDSVEIIDAGSSSGTVILAGGEGNNTITGGAGNSSLWGGSGDFNDVLNAGSGDNVFYYGLNEGNDVINDTKSSDVVMLYNMTLSDLKGAVIDGDKITLTQMNGQKLTINGQANTFTLSDGTTWIADHNSNTWAQKV